MEAVFLVDSQTVDKSGRWRRGTGEAADAYTDNDHTRLLHDIGTVCFRVVSWPPDGAGQTAAVWKFWPSENDTWQEGDVGGAAVAEQKQLPEEDCAQGNV